MDATLPICQTCGVQYPAPRPDCPVCEDDRQWVPPTGQAWTSLEELRRTHKNVWTEEEPGVWSVVTEPRFGIGQRAHLVITPNGNVLWDCITLLDDATVDRIRELGGVTAIAVSHPHYYSTMANWSEALGNAPIWIHADDANWIMQPTPAVRFWQGKSMDLLDGIQLIRSGGHFPGYQVAHYPAGADGRGVLLAGDQPQVCMDGKWVTFMYSYPNWIPFDAAAVRRIADSLEPLKYERLYGAFGRNLRDNAKDIVGRSVERYLRAIGAANAP